MEDKDIGELVGALRFGLRHPLGFGVTDHNDLGLGPGSNRVPLGVS